MQVICSLNTCLNGLNTVSTKALSTMFCSSETAHTTHASVDKQGLASNSQGLVGFFCFFFVQHLKVASWQMGETSDTSNQYVLRFYMTGFCWNQAGSILSQLYQKLYLYIIKYAFKCFSTDTLLVCGGVFFLCFFGKRSHYPLHCLNWPIDCWALTDTCISGRSCSLDWWIDCPASPFLWNKHHTLQ